MRKVLHKIIVFSLGICLVLCFACNKSAAIPATETNTPKPYEYAGESRVMAWHNPAYEKPEYAEGSDFRVWVSNKSDPDREYTYYGTVHWVENQGNHIFSLLCLPSDYDGTQKYPLLLMVHGYNSTFHEYDYFTNFLTESGYAVLYFDFRGGHASQGLSDGKLIEMSYDTKLSDIRAMTDFAAGLEMVDPDKLIFVGHSQGGMMGMITACDDNLKDRFLGMLLFAPGAGHATYLDEFGSLDNLPDSYSILTEKVGRDFLYSAVKYEQIVWNKLCDYTKPVKIWIGDADEIIPTQTAIDLAAAFGENASYEIVPGGYHDFRGDVLPSLMPDSIIPFLDSLL